MAQKKDAGQAEVESKLSKEQEQGFIGNQADETPDHHYTVEGVAAGKKTPENPRGAKPGEAP